MRQATPLAVASNATVAFARARRCCEYILACRFVDVDSVKFAGEELSANAPQKDQQCF